MSDEFWEWACKVSYVVNPLLIVAWVYIGYTYYYNPKIEYKEVPAKILSCPGNKQPILVAKYVQDCRCEIRQPDYDKGENNHDFKGMVCQKCENGSDWECEPELAPDIPEMYPDDIGIVIRDNYFRSY